MTAKSPFLDWLNTLLDLNKDKPLKDIAAELGYDKPNLISMFRNGTTKVPLTKLPALAKALHADPGHLMRLATDAYASDLLKAWDATMGFLSREERELLDEYRTAVKGKPLEDREPRFLPDTFFDDYRALLRKYA
jgi:transcriptional regulator with XRE-family HTH domain